MPVSCDWGRKSESRDAKNSIMVLEHDTIAAPATATGGAIALIRISGERAIAICDSLFQGRKTLSKAEANTVHYGRITDGERIVDDVLATLFRAPKSYTGEDSVEISCHGSSYIVSEIFALLIRAGARMAHPGEFTTRAFLAGKLDLAQAEAVADLIASSSRAAHALASTQMRGGYSDALAKLRSKLVRLTSLLELELDFSEEDVQFADRSELQLNMQQIGDAIDTLRHSFALGNALKQGVAVAIVGAPNVGKSTLLNQLLNEERAMVSEIAGTTRDTIEAHTNIEGVLFRFIDTAGLHATNDKLEQMGIERTYASIEQAQIVLCMTDATQSQIPHNEPHDDRHENPCHELYRDLRNTLHDDPHNELHDNLRQKSSIALHDDCHHDSCTALRDNLRRDRQFIRIVNKIDKIPDVQLPTGVIGISAKNGLGIDSLRHALRAAVDTETVYHGDAVVSSTRHYEALMAARTALDRAYAALGEGHPADLLSEDIRDVLYHLGTITGEITNDEILGNIFSKFCIGK